MLQAESFLEMVDDNNLEDINRVINISIREENNNVRIINMSEFKLEIFNDTNRLFEQNILINEFRSRENNDNINNKIILKDINENIYTIDPLDLNVENNIIEENQKYIKISIAYNDDNINRNHVKKIQIDANDKFGTSKINYF